MADSTRDLPDRLGAPARRALDGAGVTCLDDLTTMTEDQVAALHGVGPTALDKLRAALDANRMTFSSTTVGRWSYTRMLWMRS